MVLSDTEYENTIDFSQLIESAQKLLQVPCHLVINDAASSSRVKVEIDDSKMADVFDMVKISTCERISDR